MPRHLVLIAALLALDGPAAAQRFEGWFFTQGFIGGTVFAHTGTQDYMPGEAPPDGRRALILLRCAHPMRAGATDTIGFTPPGQVMLALTREMVGSDGPSGRQDIALGVDGQEIALGPFGRVVEDEGTPYAEVLCVQRIPLDHPLPAALRRGRELRVSAGGGPPMRVSLVDAERQVGRQPEACAQLVPGR
ncbi:MAG: hypothetical protein ACK4PG_10500 [Acetobacteraceae bacterium]